MSAGSPLLHPTPDGSRFELRDPYMMPKASAFLWNRRMMIHTTCRGYAVAQFMQPEPAKYAHPPVLAAKTFMQPEQPYFSHHPGRFVYVKDEDTRQVFSAPYEPARAKLDSFCFSVGKSDLLWTVERGGISVQMRLTLAVDETVEMWSVRVKNTSEQPRRISVYPYFPVGYPSWMNLSGRYRADLKAVVCSCITPYQKLEDYEKNKLLKDKTFLLAELAPNAWEVNQEAFEGEGGLVYPDAIAKEQLAGGEASYEVPTCALQYRMALAPGEEKALRFLFGPAYDDHEIVAIRERFFTPGSFERESEDYASYVQSAEGCLRIETPDPQFDNYVNHWLPRQLFYHGDVNRLTTDPQTRNYLQDNMGMAYVAPSLTRAALITALTQQHASGAMPDGVLIHEQAELKYINQIPHTDHCVWIPLALQAYLDETHDIDLLNERIRFADDAKPTSVYDHVAKAMLWLVNARDHRGLSFIAQGDWCDPMNMVGPKGKGVSGWLTLASAYALQVWAGICATLGKPSDADAALKHADDMNAAVNKHLWDGHWFARGITDDDVVFGVATDQEGKIYLNPQGWALLSGAASAEQQQHMLSAIDEHLQTPFGLMMLGPPYTAMRNDVGRLTQKFPGSAENGSCYNHAAAFYAYGLYTAQSADRAFAVLRNMIPGPDEGDYVQRGQLPVFIPNYYRGGHKLYPRTAGRSSQLFNTGTVAWYQRCLLDGLFGLRGCAEGLLVAPHLPSSWTQARASRRFRGAQFDVEYQRVPGQRHIEVIVNGEVLEKPCITDIRSGEHHQVLVLLPESI
ncbi:MAG: NdvB protein [Deltaproteobacteria bacterium]|nr:NdvB protein [Deltaproteobacteria bacterium]